jgi:hypothetical protein
MTTFVPACAGCSHVKCTDCDVEPSDAWPRQSDRLAEEAEFKTGAPKGGSNVPAFHSELDSQPVVAAGEAIDMWYAPSTPPVLPSSATSLAKGSLITPIDPDKSGSSSECPSKYFAILHRPNTLNSQNLKKDDSFFQLTPKILDELLQQYHSWRRRSGKDSPESSSPGGGGFLESSARNTAPPVRISRHCEKRRHCEGSDSEREESSGRGRPHKPAKKHKATRNSEPIFACPHFKKDPNRYGCCFKYKLSRIRDVKQHLRRRHSAQHEEGCEASSSDAEQEVTDKLTHQQSENLKKPVGRMLTPEEQWYVIWDTVYPGFAKPNSPYLESRLAEELNAFQSFYHSHGYAIVSEIAHGHGIVFVEDDRHRLNLVLTAALDRVLEGFRSGGQLQSLTNRPCGQEGSNDNNISSSWDSTDFGTSIFDFGDESPNSGNFSTEGEASNADNLYSSMEALPTCLDEQEDININESDFE